MTEDEYRELVALERIKAHNHLNGLLYAWRRELWPHPYTDPIAHEERRRRFIARELDSQAYWGTPSRRLIYGGICAS